MNKLLFVSLLFLLSITIQAQLKVGDVGYPRREIQHALFFSVSKIDSIIIVPTDPKHKIEYSFHMDEYLIIKNKYYDIEDYLSSVDLSIASRIVPNKQNFDYINDKVKYIIQNYRNKESYHAKAFFNSGKKIRYVYVEIIYSRFDKDKLLERIKYVESIENLTPLKDTNIYKIFVLHSSIYSNIINSKGAEFTIPNLIKREQKEVSEAEIIDRKISENKKLAQLQKEKEEEEERKNREEEKQKLLDVVSNGDSNIRNAIVTYSPVKGMTLDQIEYMNEINEGVLLKYDKFDRETGTGIIYYIEGSSGFSYVNTRMIFYYFRNNKFVDVYRDLVSVEKVHGKFIVK